MLVAAGADPNARVGHDGEEHAGATPLHFVARYGTAESVRVLTAAGGDPNARNLLGDTALHRWASAWATNWQTYQQGTVGALLDAGADATARNAAGETPWDILHKNELLEKVRGSDDYWRLNDARFKGPRPAEPGEPDGL